MKTPIGYIMDEDGLLQPTNNDHTHNPSMSILHHNNTTATPQQQANRDAAAWDAAIWDAATWEAAAWDAAG